MVKIANQKGIAFVTAVVLMVLFLNLGLGYLTMARTQLQIARNQLDTLKVLYNSESAVQHSKAEIVNNVDVDGDGLGILPPKDLDGDLQPDYSAQYSSITGIITGSGNVGNSGIVRVIEDKIKPKQWTGAMQVGRNINASSGNTGTISGNVDAKGTIIISAGLTGGQRTPNNTALQIPTVTISSYGSIANWIISGNTTWLSAPPNGNGIYFINGNLTIGGVTNFNLQGSLIVTGTLTISSCLGTFTIQATGNNPAIVAGTNITVNLTPSTKFNIQGLVYAAQDISLSTMGSPNQITGALVSGRDLFLMSTTSDQIVFDSTLNPPFFIGGGPGITNVYWKGHK